MRTIRKLTTILILVCVAIQAGMAYGLTIRFQRQVTVDKPFVYLGDIAEITGSDVSDISAYRSAKLVPAPPSGSQVVLDFDTVRNRLHALGLSLSQIEFTGSSRVLIKGAQLPSGTTLLPQATSERLNGSMHGQAMQAERMIQKIVRNKMMKQVNLFDITERDIVVHLEDQAISRLADSNAAEWQIESWTAPRAGVSHLILVATARTAAGEPEKVECDIQMPPLVLTVKQRVQAGHTIQATDLSWMYANKSFAIDKPQDVIGMEAKRNLTPGMEITEDDLQKKPYVRPRDLVAVYARQGGVTVKRTMRAMKGGGLGDTVPLISLSGKEKFTARIIGYHQTEVIDSVVGE